MRTIKMYPSYDWGGRDHDPVIDEIFTAIKDEGVTWTWIEQKSGVTRTTLAAWRSGKTKRPQHPTIEAVFRCLGYETIRRHKGTGRVVEMKRKWR